MLCYLRHSHRIFPRDKALECPLTASNGEKGIVLWQASNHAEAFWGSHLGGELI